jgi:hypothetical protein
MKVIETRFDGHIFRSRTEARWAVFFKTAGIRYEYEKEGFDLDGRWYLPDFWLRDMQLWLEVKGDEPTAEERGLCEKLATASGYGLCWRSVHRSRMKTYFGFHQSTVPMTR